MKIGVAVGFKVSSLRLLIVSLLLSRAGWNKKRHFCLFFGILMMNYKKFSAKNMLFVHLQMQVGVTINVEACSLVYWWCFCYLC